MSRPCRGGRHAFLLPASKKRAERAIALSSLGYHESHSTFCAPRSGFRTPVESAGLQKPETGLRGASCASRKGLRDLGALRMPFSHLRGGLKPPHCSGAFIPPVRFSSAGASCASRSGLRDASSASRKGLRDLGSPAHAIQPPSRRPEAASL